MTTVQELFDQAQAAHAAEVAAQPDRYHSDWELDHWAPTYDDLVTLQGAEIAEWAELGEYQGDLLYLLRDPATGHYAFLIVGYGSCSGCDDIEERRGNIPALQELADDLQPAPEDWKPAAEMLAYFQDRDWTAYYYYRDPATPAFVARCLARLQAEQEPTHAG